jgi:dCMP deaminase
VIIGLSGRNGAGKGEVLAFLESRSFYAHSLSDVIREELARQGLEESRERMIETGNAIRAEHGPGGLAVLLSKQLLPDRNYVIDSVRHPAEVEVLRARGPGFQLWWVDADEAVRLERIRSRGRSGDPDTLEKLRELEGRELASDDPNAQQLLAVEALADQRILNDSDVEALRRQVQALLERSYFFERPSWDEYFMSIARVVASRSNCVKRKVAAVITRDRRIISTGYNGTRWQVLLLSSDQVPALGAFGLHGHVCSFGEQSDHLLAFAHLHDQFAGRIAAGLRDPVAQ